MATHACRSEDQQRGNSHTVESGWYVYKRSVHYIDACMLGKKSPSFLRRV